MDIITYKKQVQRFPALRPAVLGEREGITRKPTRASREAFTRLKAGNLATLFLGSGLAVHYRRPKENQHREERARPWNRGNGAGGV